MVSQPSPRKDAPREDHADSRGDRRRRSFRIFPETVEAWPGLGLYERFEQLVSLLLTLLIGIVIVIAIVHLVIEVSHLLVTSLFTPVGHETFQAIFGMILTVLIAMEFNHSILGILRRKQSVVRLRTVIVIALLAMARKFIIIDATITDPLVIVGLAFAVLALGCIYWLVHEQDRRETEDDDSRSATPG